MGIRDIFLVILYLITIVFATTEHEPKVHEELDEYTPEYVRTTRHLDGSQKIYQPPLFNYRAVVQQDRLKSRYNRQQQADSRNLKKAPVNSDIISGLHRYLGQNRGKPISIPFDDKDSDWKPFQPKFLNAAKTTPITKKKKQTEFVKQNDIVTEDIPENDLDIAGSEIKEQTVKTDRHDQRSQYIYITPSILKNNFGLDSETTRQILQNSAPENVKANSDMFQISELQELLGKNPALQLQGLQKLLEDAESTGENNIPISTQKENAGIQIEHNGSPPLPSSIPGLATLQEQIDAVNKAQEQQVLAAAQKKAEAHVQAQHHALALAQSQAQEEALAKIAAHNQGLSTLSPSGHFKLPEGVDQITAAPAIQESVSEAKPEEHFQEIDQNSVELQHEGTNNIESPEVAALQARPYEQAIVHSGRAYAGSYHSPAQDLRNIKPRIQEDRGRFYRPSSFARPDTEAHKIQYLSAGAPLYNQKEVHNYSPVSPYTPHLIPHNKVTHKIQYLATDTPLYNQKEVKNYTPHFVSQKEVDFHKFISEPTKPSLANLPTLQNHIQESYQQVRVEPPPVEEKQLYSDEQHNQHDDQSQNQYAAKYAFGYRIVDEKHGNDFGHEEERDGKLTKGHYYVTLPDGRKQRVEYHADKSGYHARVSYENTGRHPYIPRQPTNHADHLKSVHK